MVEDTTKAVRKSVVSHLSSSSFLAMCIVFSGFSNCGDDIRGMVWKTILIHILLFIPVEMFFLSMIIKGYLKKIWRDVAYILWVLVLSAWYIHVTDLFFRSSNDWRSKSTMIWISHLVILIEAFGIFWLEGWFIILIAILCVVMWVMIKSQMNKSQRNVKIKNMLKNIATMKFDPTLHSDDDWIICMEPYTQEQEIIQLPCNSKHYFHGHCITQWVERNACWPICKKEITQQILNDAKGKYN